MIEQQIEDIKNSLREMIQLITQRGEPLSNELKLKIAQVMEHAANRIKELRQQQNEQTPATPQEAPSAPEMPLGIDLLWILAGGQPDAFVNYLRTVPDPALNAILRNPEQLKSIIHNLSKTMPQGRQESINGIEHAPINSSNIYGFRYDPRSGRLLVRFQSGSVYGYEGVPSGVFKIFQHGAVPARTSGQNRFGKWWTGKIPSLGAAFYELIRNGGYPYQRLQ